MDLPASLYDLPRTLLGFHVALVKESRTRKRPSSIADRLARLEALEDIRDVIRQYAYCYDAGDIDGLMEIYSTDCRLINNKGTFIGNEAIRENYLENIDARSLGFHHVTDVQVVLDETLTWAWASGFLYNAAVRKGVATGTMGSCLFHLQAVQGSWIVTESRIVVSNRHRYLLREVPGSDLSSFATEPGTVADLLDDEYSS